MGSIPKIQMGMIIVVSMISSVATLGGNVAFAQQNDVASELIDFILHDSNNLGSSILDIGREVNDNIPSGFENIKESVSSTLDRAQIALDDAIEIDR
jgi:hypothetical protein